MPRDIPPIHVITHTHTHNNTLNMKIIYITKATKSSKVIDFSAFSHETNLSWFCSTLFFSVICCCTHLLYTWRYIYTTTTTTCKRDMNMFWFVFLIQQRAYIRLCIWYLLLKRNANPGKQQFYNTRAHT